MYTFNEIPAAAQEMITYAFSHAGGVHAENRLTGEVENVRVDDYADDGCFNRYFVTPGQRVLVSDGRDGFFVFTVKARYERHVSVKEFPKMRVEYPEILAVEWN